MSMGARILRKLAVFAVSLLVASVLIFLVANALPGDVAQVILGTDATPEAVAELRAQLGLDRPLIVRYLAWIGGVVTGDFGTSVLSGDSVASLMGPRIAVTAWLVGLGLAGSALIALPAGMVAALRRRRLSAATMPAGRAISAEPASPSPTSQAVTAIRGAIRDATASPLSTDVPKSPVTTPPIQAR